MTGPAAGSTSGRSGAAGVAGPAAAVLAGLLVAVAAGAEDGTVRFDFETGDLQGWRVVEGGFDEFVCDKEFFRNEPRVRYNKQGRWFLTTLEKKDGNGNDRMTGVAESPVFEPSAPGMTFLVGGGSHADTYVALCTLDGREVLTARGVNHERMQRVEWRAPELVGKKVFLRIVDRNRGGWGHVTFDDFAARGRIDGEATRSWAARAAWRRLSGRDTAPLRSAIRDLVATFGERYARGREFLRRLEDCERRMEDLGRLAAAGEGADAAELLDGPVEEVVERLVRELASLEREALVANPLVSGRPILFVVRKQYRPDHHNTATIFQTGEINTGSFTGGGALKAVDLGSGGVARTFVDLPGGVVRDPEVSFDGRRIVFSMRKDRSDDYHVYEIGSDGTGLRQLTSAPGVSDIDPLYLPEGDIAFSSTREPKFCMCNRHIMANLFRMRADGANIHQIGKSTLFEGHGALLPDGRIMYYRWEYVDRNFGDAQGLWTVNPDGTNHAVYWGNNTDSPGAVIDARAIPGTERVITTFSSCHDRPWGAIAIVDRRLGLDGRGPVVRTWPASAVDFVGRGGYDAFQRVNPKYEDPYPLSDKHFLCSRQTGRGEEMGIYLLDVFGNETLLHAEAPGCFDPMPLGPRARPPAIPPRREFVADKGMFYVVDVYRGTHMKGVERGAVKRLRVVESPEKQAWTHANWQGSGTQAPGMAWNDFNNKRILGTAPVEADGSAYFAVPAERFVYFQLLDEDGMMVQSMRSGTIVQPGETTGCVGCHDARLSAPPPTPTTGPAALKGRPRALSPWYGETSAGPAEPPRLFGYAAEVQPVFDRNCVECHDYGGKGSKKVVLAGDRGLAFNASYFEIRSRNLVNVVGAGPTATTPAYSWGSHRSRLVEILRKGHNDIRLSPEDFDRIVTWIDINAPYYPTYASAYPRNLYGRSPLDDGKLNRLGELVRTNLRDQRNASQVSFDRPEKSPCLVELARKGGPGYNEALAIIREGKKALALWPRADMPGFRACEVDLGRAEKYATRREAELRVRDALRRGERVYDEGLPSRPGPGPGGETR